MTRHRPWCLLGDIGGTHARFAVGDVQEHGLHEVASLSVADHPAFTGALKHYLACVAERRRWHRQPAEVCLAVACPPGQDPLRFTNSDWVLDRDDLAHVLGACPVHVINDFEAVGHAVPHLSTEDWEQVGSGSTRTGRPIAVLGPGTGLGACTVLPGADGAQVLAGEGGHVDFAPVDETEIEILRLLLTRYPRVSAERLLSGAGIENIYWALTQLRGAGHRLDDAPAISAAALAGEDPVAVETLSVFCRVLGAVAGNLALTVGAHGGVYIAGGIAPRILPLLRGGDFRERFLAKGRFRDYLENVPTRIVTRNDAGLFGVLQFLRHSNGS